MTRWKHALALGLIALLVVSPIASVVAPFGGPAGTATAQTDTNTTDCEMPRTAGGFLYQQFFADCSDPQEEYADKLEAYNDAQTTEAHLETALTMAENNVYDAENQGWIEAESALFEAYQDGANKSEAIQAGLDAIESHYATRQANLIELQNNVLLDLYTIQNESKSFSVPSHPDYPNAYLINRMDRYPAIEVKHNNFEHSPDDDWVNSPEALNINISSYTSESQTLVDGSEKTVNSLEIEGDIWYNDGNNWEQARAHNNDGTTDVPLLATNYNLLSGEMEVSNSYRGSWNATLTKIQAHRYPDGYPQETAVHNTITRFSRWGDLWSDLNQSAQEQKTEFETFANTSYDELENPDSDFSAEDLLSRLTQMNEYSLTLDDPENATFNDAVIGLSAAGLSPPSDESAYLNVSYQTGFNTSMTTEWGMLMAHEGPAGGWETGVTYNTTDLPSNPIVVNMDGNQSLVKGDLRIEGVYDRNGSVIDDANITSPDRDFQATNLTVLRQDIKDLSDQIATIRNQTATPGGGGGAVAWPDLGIPNPLDALGTVGQWIALVAVAFVALLLLTVVS